MSKAYGLSHAAAAVFLATGMTFVSGLHPMVGGAGVLAMGDAPKPVVDCRKRKNRTKPECKPSSAETPADTAAGAGSTLKADQVYPTAYALAQAGNYEAARTLLLSIGETRDPRILNYLGFTTRKLGDASAALPYYEKALAIRPDYAVARSYYGEALIAVGDIAAARVELAKIKAICGTTCEAYAKLDAKLKSTAG